MGEGAPRIVVLGGINMDLVTLTPRFPAAGETVVGRQFLTYGGGKGANQAVAAGRMGAQVAMVGRVGDDVFAAQALRALTEAGVDVATVGVTADTSTGLAIISIDDGAQNQIIQVLGANDTCGQEEEDKVLGLLEGADALAAATGGVGGLVAAVRPGGQGTRGAGDSGPQSGKAIACGVLRLLRHYHAQRDGCGGFGGRAGYRPGVGGAGGGDFAESGRGNGDSYAGAAGDGVTPRRREAGFVPAFEVAAVDSVGAGDAFNGALAVALAEGRELAEAVRVGSAAGALAVTKSGAQDSMPGRGEVEGMVGN